MIHHSSGMIIGNLKADTDRKALNIAKKIYGTTVTISHV
jgi:hypothetical protein